MQTEVVEVSPVTKEVKATFSAEEVDQAFTRNTKAVSGKVNLPGFRPGKAPASLVMSRFADEIRQRVMQELTEKAVSSALTEHKLKPIGQLEKKDEAKSEPISGAPFNLSLTFEVHPEIKLGEYKGLKLTKPKLLVSEEDVTRELEVLRKRGGQLVPVLVREVLEENDYALLDTEISLAGQVIENGKSQDQLVELNRTTDFIPGFVDALLGMRINESRRFELDYPAESSNAQLAGKRVTYNVTLKQLKRLDLPALDDEFAKDFGAESLAALKETLTKALTNRQETKIRARLREEIYDQLIASHPFEPPPSLVRRQTSAVLMDVLQRIGRDRMPNLEPEQINQIAKTYEPQAIKTVRAGLIMGEIAMAEQMMVSDADLDAHIEQLAQLNGQDPARVRGMYASEDRKESLRYQLIDDKVLDFLVANSQISEGEPLPAEERTLG